MGLTPQATQMMPRIPTGHHLQIKMHQSLSRSLFGGPISKGFFPPEMAFSARMLPALADADITG